MIWSVEFNEVGYVARSEWSREEECCVSFPNTTIAPVDLVASPGKSSCLWTPLFLALFFLTIYRIATPSPLTSFVSISEFVKLLFLDYMMQKCFYLINLIKLKLILEKWIYVKVA